MTPLAWVGCALAVLVTLIAEACLDPDRRAKRRSSRKVQATRRVQLGGYRTIAGPTAVSPRHDSAPILHKDGTLEYPHAPHLTRKLGPPPGSCATPRKPWMTERSLNPKTLHLKDGRSLESAMRRPAPNPKI